MLQASQSYHNSCALSISSSNYYVDLPVIRPCKKLGKLPFAALLFLDIKISKNKIMHLKIWILFLNSKSNGR